MIYFLITTGVIYFFQSGRMYYVNRKTMKKTWEWPKEQKQAHQLNLELNISTTGGHFYEDRHHKKHHHPSSSSSPPQPSNGAGGENMIALPCSNCHLLVIVSQTSPSCPNCKFVQYSAAGSQSPAKPFHSGLSLFNWAARDTMIIGTDGGSNGLYIHTLVVRIFILIVLAR